LILALWEFELHGIDSRRRLRIKISMLQKLAPKTGIYHSIHYISNIFCGFTTKPFITGVNPFLAGII